MPELYDEDSDRLLLAGEVVMVARQMRDKTTRKPFLWKFFMVLSEAEDGFGDRITGYVVGATNERLREKPLNVYVGDDKNTIHYLDQSEWPDGIHAFRMALIMQRKVEIE